MVNPENDLCGPEPVTPEWEDERTPVCSSRCKQHRQTTGVDTAGKQRTVTWCALAAFETRVCLPAIARGAKHQSTAARMRGLLEEVSADTLGGCPSAFAPKRGWDEWHDMVESVLGDTSDEEP